MPPEQSVRCVTCLAASQMHAQCLRFGDRLPNETAEMKLDLPAAGLQDTLHSSCLLVVRVSVRASWSSLPQVHAPPSTCCSSVFAVRLQQIG